MPRPLSPLWVAGPTSHIMHRKREYTQRGGRTLCGIKVAKGWKHVLHAERRCKRCAA